jgi:MFS family permease
MILPTIMAALADNLPPEKLGKAVGFITSSSWVGVALGVPAIALLIYIGGWRLPFYITGGLLLAAYFRYVRQKAGAPNRAFAYGPGSFGFRSGVELRFPTGPTAHHRHRIRNDSPDHHGGVGRQLTA